MKTYCLPVLLVLLVLLCPGYAQSTAIFFECNDCSEAGYRQRVVAAAEQQTFAADQDIYVADLTRENLRRFRIFAESEPGMSVRRVLRLQPEAYALDNFEQFLLARSELFAQLAALDFTVQVPPGHIVGSAYELWGNNGKRLLMQEFINAELGLLELAFSEFFATGSFLLDRNSSHIIVKVDFPDGSSAFFELTGKMQGLIWAYREGESIDANGNLIPDSIAAFSEYHGLFDALSVQDFLLRAALYGIPVIDESNGSPLVAVVCVQDAAGGYLCEVSAVQ